MPNRRQILAHSLFLALLMIASSGLTWAQSDYPSKPVKVIVAFPPGGTSDVMGRMVAEELGKLLRQPFVVENIGGVGGGRGVEILFEARAQQPVVVDIPEFAVEGGDLAPRVEGGNIPANEPLVHLGRTRPAGGGLGIARAPGVLLRGEESAGQKDKQCGEKWSHDLVRSVA